MELQLTSRDSTSITTATVTATDSPSLVTVTVTTDNTQLNTIQETVTSVTTIEDTVTVIAPSAVQVINTIFSPTTVTAISQATVVPAKRDLAILPLPTVPSQPDAIKARAVFTTSSAPATCAATTSAPTSVPTYASACSGTVRYSSACSCAGVTGAATTLTPSTIVSTTTSTFHYTPTSTVTATATNNIPVTVIQTQVVPATFETTDATLVVPSVYTQTTEVVVPTTVVVSPPACTAYNFVVTNGVRAGQFVSGGHPSVSVTSYGFVNFTSNAIQASAFTVRSDGRVYDSNTYGWVTGGSSLYYVLQMTDSSQAVYGLRSVFCTIGNGDSSYPGAIGMLTCTSNGAPTNLLYCPQLSNNLGQAPNVQAGCTQASLAVLRASSC